MAFTLNTKAYAFSGIANSITSYLYKAAGGVSNAFSVVTAQVGLASANSPNDAKNRVKWKLSMPAVAESASACACPGSVVSLADADITVRFTKNMTDTERTDFGLRLQELVATPEFQASLVSFPQPTS